MCVCVRAVRRPCGDECKESIVAEVYTEQGKDPVAALQCRARGSPGRVVVGGAVPGEPLRPGRRVTASGPWKMASPSGLILI